MLYIILIVFGLLIVAVIAKNIKRTEILEVLTHTFLYLLEILIVTTLIVNYLFQCYSFVPFRDLLEISVLKDYVFAYTLYQLLLLITFKLKDYLDIDAYTALKTFIDRYQLHGEFKIKIPQELIEMNNEGLNSIYLNEKQREIVRQVNPLVIAYNNDEISVEQFRFSLKQLIINVDLAMKISSYGWMQSILLRTFK